MKRTFFLLLTLLLTFSGFAQQANTSKGMAKTMPFDKSLMKKPASVGSLNKAPKKTDEAQTVDITITGSYTFYFDVDDEEETSDWFFSATDVTGLYTVRLDWPAEYDEKYGTFTLDNLDKDYSYIKDMSTGEMEYRNYVEGTTFTVSEVNGKLHIEGTLVCDNGVTYNLYFDHTPQTINIENAELTDIYYFSEDTDWYMRFNDENYRISLDINTGSESKFAGTYTEADAVDYYNFASELSIGNYDPFVTFTVKFELPEGVTDPTEACEVTGTALTEHGDTYHFHMMKGLPITPIKTVDLDVDLKTVEWPSKRDDCKSYFELTEKDSEGAPTGNQWNLGLDALLGSLVTSNIVEDLSGRVSSATGETMAIDNGTVTLVFDSLTTTLKVNADLVMEDSVEYRFAFDYKIPVKGTVSYDFSNLTLNDDYYSDMGIQWLDAKNDKVSFEMTLTNAEVPGEYDDSTASVQMAVTDADGEKSAVSSVVIIEASTTIDEHNQPVLYAKFLGSNKRIYTVNAYYDIPAPKDTLDISMEGLKVSDMTTSIGAFQIYGYNNDSTVYVSLVPEAIQIPGSYTTEDLTAYNNYSFIALQKEDGSYEMNDIYTADFNVTQNDRDVALTGVFQAGPHLINLTLKGLVRLNGLDYDNEDEDLDVTFTLDDLVELTKDEDYGYAFVELQNKERNDVFAMLLFTDAFDEEIVIPAGTYNVNETYRAGSVQPGEVSNDVVYSTFYGTLDSDGYLNTPMWFLRSGTVTVTKTDDDLLQFEAVGQNSYGRSIHVTLNGTYNAIKDVNLDENRNVNVVKYINNGSVVIRKGSQEYLLNGQRLK